MPRRDPAIPPSPSADGTPAKNPLVRMKGACEAVFQTARCATGSSRFVATCAPILLTLLFALLCWSGLAQKALWNDEAFSFFVAFDGLPHTLAMMRQDTQPPLYYLLLSMWLALGHGVTVLRGLSAVTMILSVPLLFSAARRLLGLQVAVLATLLFVLSPDCLAWAQKARPYPLQVGCIALCFWGFVRVWMGEPRRVWIGWGAYVLGGAAAVLAQYPAVFFLLAMAVAATLRSILAWREDRRTARDWALAHLAMALIWLLWLPDGLAQVLAHLRPDTIAADHAGFLVDRAWMAGTLADLLGVPFLWRAQPPFVLLNILIAGIGTITLLRRGRPGWPVLAGVFVPYAVCLGAWACVHPIFGYVMYSFVWLRIPYTILLAAGLSAIRSAWLRGAIVLVMLGGLVLGIVHEKAIRTVPLDQVAERIAASLQTGDAVILSRSAATRWALAYYLGPPFAGRLVGLDVADAPAAGWPIRSPEQTLRQQRLWVVLPDGEPPPFDLTALAPIFHRAMTEHIGNVTIERYDR